MFMALEFSWRSRASRSNGVHWQSGSELAERGRAPEVLVGVPSGLVGWSGRVLQSLGIARPWSYVAKFGTRRPLASNFRLPLSDVT